MFVARTPVVLGLGSVTRSGTAVGWASAGKQSVGVVAARDAVRGHDRAGEAEHHYQDHQAAALTPERAVDRAEPR
jgi:hypothetical protein